MVYESVYAFMILLILVNFFHLQSTIRTSVLGKPHIVPQTHLAAFRWLIDSSKFENDPQFSWILGDGPQGPRVLSGPEGEVFSYPCRNKTLFNVTAVFKDKRDQDAVGMLRIFYDG